MGSNHQEKSATPLSSPSASPGEGGDGEQDDEEGEEDDEEEESKPEYSNLAAIFSLIFPKSIGRPELE